MNRLLYFNYIEEQLNVHATRVNSRGKLNALDIHVHSENFYQYLLNEVFGWSLKNENESKRNVEAIDLVDKDNKIVAQVSATVSKQKIEDSLSHELIKNYTDYTFKFISISKNADDLRKKNFKNPYGITFVPTIDIVDIESILSKIKGLDIDAQKQVYKLVKKELGSDQLTSR